MSPARLPPGSARDIGPLNFAITRALGVATGGAPPHIFTTLARHRRLFRRWLRFAGALMPGGTLRRVDSELLILRVAHNCACEYEWGHHERIAQSVGLSAEEVQRVRGGARVALLGLEPELLREVAAACGDASWFECDVADRDQVDEAVAGAVRALGGLDVAIANAGIGAQMTLVDGDPSVWDATLAVNLTGSYNLVRAAAPHVRHPRGYFLLTASLAAAGHLPPIAAYRASNAAREALRDSP